MAGAWNPHLHADDYYRERIRRHYILHDCHEQLRAENFWMFGYFFQEYVIYSFLFPSINPIYQRLSRYDTNDHYNNHFHDDPPAEIFPGFAFSHQVPSYSNDHSFYDQYGVHSRYTYCQHEPHGAETDDQLMHISELEDETLSSDIDDWDDSSVRSLEEDEEVLILYALDEDGPWEDFTSTDAHLSIETITRNLKTRDPDVNRDEHEMCVVCQDCLLQEEDKIATLDCGHDYHMCCIGNWLLQKNGCPLCNAVGIPINYIIN